jgi:hypothetical protein
MSSQGAELIDFVKLASVLKSFGPTPVLTILIGLGAFAALSAGANAIAVCFVAFLVIGGHLWGQERKFVWRQRELDNALDQGLRVRAAQATDRLDARLAGKRRAEAFPPNGDTP